MCEKDMVNSDLTLLIQCKLKPIQKKVNRSKPNDLRSAEDIDHGRLCSTTCSFFEHFKIAMVYLFSGMDSLLFMCSAQ